ncbi:hypothetical protein BN946_scf184569.g12 [Trametes cinnabarina]|uniref:Uncharacterized protein n=1 Tax=Pycnoporus cinnabarinus TaxID=5643 RepID=A0A060SDW9_PYCCI|nr:hypothetical protein BN946_scf184569.g12 [Trametes cinnabarina]
MMGPDFSSDWYRDLLELLSTTSRSTTRISIIERDDMAHELWFGKKQINMLLALFPDLASLTLRNVTPTMYLRALTPLDDGEVPCPHLASLTVSGTWAVDSISTATFRESCEVMKNAFTKRSAAGSVLNVLDVTCVRSTAMEMSEQVALEGLERCLKELGAALESLVKHVRVQTFDHWLESEATVSTASSSPSI